jgi:hypothetical protein
MSADFTVKIVDQGRAGTITYCEGAMTLALWWEFMTDGAWIWAPSAAQWDDYWRTRNAPDAAGRRDEILGRVAAETKRQRATSARTSIDDDGISLKF